MRWLNAETIVPMQFVMGVWGVVIGTWLLTWGVIG